MFVQCIDTVCVIVCVVVEYNNRTIDIAQSNKFTISFSISSANILDSLLKINCFHRNLDLSFNHIRVIGGLSTLTNLKDLFLINNKLTVIEGLNTLTNLTILELGSNRLRVCLNGWIGG